jgi:methionine synthase II (cobalamin-independent)
MPKRGVLRYPRRTWGANGTPATERLDFATLTLCVGVVDTQDSAVESVAVIRDRIQAALERIEPERLWLSPDCGLRTLPPDSARAKLANLAEAVNDLRATL